VRTPHHGPTKANGGKLGLRPVGEDQYELVHPPCVEERLLDLEEGLEAWQAGAVDEAREALRFALEGCGDNLRVHVALGRIALQEDHDARLARGHLGYAFELAMRAITTTFTGVLPPELDANRPFYEAIEGLMACLEQLGRGQERAELAALRDRLSGATR
jgi:hypothetical protein